MYCNERPARVLYQKTISDKITLQSIGLHSGRDCQITLLPAHENQGIRFHHDAPGRNRSSISAHWSNVVNTVLCTELQSKDGERIRTIEHVMSALRACNVDNVEIHCSANEIPILDGSAKPFVDAIRAVGLTRQNAPRRVLKIRKPVRVVDGDKWVELIPYDGCRYDVEIQFDNPAIGHQLMTYELTYDSYLREIAPARTFGELEQASGLHAAGLAMGANADNTLIFDGDLVVSSEAKRFDDECIRHKILDAIGDLHLIGAPILGHFKGYKCGHKLHAQLLEAVMASDGAASWVNAPQSNVDDTYPMPTGKVLSTANGQASARTGIAAREPWTDTHAAARGSLIDLVDVPSSPSALNPT